MLRILTLFTIFLPFMVNGQSPPDHKHYATSISPNTDQDNYKYSARKELRLTPGFTVGDDASTVNSTRLNIHPYIFGPEDDNTDATGGNSSLSPDINQAQPDRSKNEDFLGLSASADNSGGAKVNIPIGLPAGNGGLTPSLVVSSSSPYVDDVVGQGMSLVGAISSITLGTRHPIYHESTSLDPTGEAGYMLNGQPLISIPDEEHLYIIPNNRDIRVYASYDNQSNLTGFEVRLSNGKTIKYEQSFLTNQFGHVITWLRTKEEDVFGNYINYKYKLDYNSILLEEIAYGGNGQDEITKVEFSYNRRVKPKLVYSFGNEVIVEKLLKRVIIKNHNVKLWEYDFSYVKNYDGTYFLRKVDRINSAGEISQPVELQWHINNGNSQYELLENFLEPVVSVDNYNAVIPFPSNNNGVLDYLVLPQYREHYPSTNGYKIVEGGNGDEPEVLFETINAGVFITTAVDKLLEEHFTKEGRWKGLSEKVFTSSSTFFTDFDKDENQDVMYLKQSIETIETENENGDPIQKLRNIYHLKYKEINELGEVIGQEEEVHPLPYFIDNPDGGICNFKGDFDQNGRQDDLILYKGISTDAESGRLDLDFIMDDGTFFRININDYIAHNVPRGSLLIDDITFENTAYFTSDFDKDGNMEIFFYSRNSHEAIFFVEFDYESKTISSATSNLLSFINDWDIVDNNYGMDLVKMDVNLDGNEDIIVYSPDNNQIYIYEGLGNGNFVRSSRSAGVIKNFLEGSRESLNHHKIIYDSYVDPHTTERVFTVEESRRKSKHTHTRFIPGDFNGDGRTDLAVVALRPDDENFFSVGIFENSWQTFRKVNQQDFKDRYFPIGEYPEFRGGHNISVQSVDFNGDGFDELFVEYGFRRSEYKDNKTQGEEVFLPIAGSIRHFLIQLNKAGTFEPELLGENFSKPGLVHTVTDSRTNYEFHYTVPYRYDLEFKNLPNGVGTGGTETATSINGGENISETILKPGYQPTDLKDYYTRPPGNTVISSIKTYQRFNGSLAKVGEEYYQFLNPLVHFRLGAFGYRTIIKWVITNPGEDNGSFNGSYIVSHFGPFTNKQRKLYEFKPTSSVSGFVNEVLDISNIFNYALRKVSRVENYFYKFKDTGPWYYSDLTYTRNEVANYFIDDNSVDYEVTFNYFDEGRLIKSDARSSERTQVITEFSGFQKPEFWYREILPTTITTTSGCIVGDVNLCDGEDNPKRPLSKTISYDLSIGLPELSVDNSNLDTKFQVISEVLSRDQFGNVVESSSQESGKDPLLSSKTYSSDGRHVLSETNAIGDVFRRKIDLVFGHVLSETNAQGFTTSSTYDKVGVLQSVTDKNGIVSRVETKWVTANDPVYNQISETSDLIVTSRLVDGGVDSWSYMDVYGRTWLTKSEDLTSSRNRFVRSYFDKFGRELGSSYPTFNLSDVNSRPKVTEVASFDYKSRPLEIYNFDRNGTLAQNSSVSYTYAESNKRFSSKMEWENGNRSLESFYNQKGQKTKVIENGDTQVEYLFNHFDELESIIAPGGVKYSPFDRPVVTQI